MNYDRLSELAREAEREGVCPSWLGETAPTEPLCVPTCPRYERLRQGHCDHEPRALTYHCRPAIRAMGLEILCGPGWPESPEKIARLLRGQLTREKRLELARLLGEP